MQGVSLRREHNSSAAKTTPELLSLQVMGRKGLPDPSWADRGHLEQTAGPERKLNKPCVDTDLLLSVRETDLLAFQVEWICCNVKKKSLKNLHNFEKHYHRNVFRFLMRLSPLWWEHPPQDDIITAIS